MARIEFPCGAKGDPSFCPNLCRYGKFCKIKAKNEEPRGLQDKDAVQEIKDDTPNVEIYY